jgi:hypothetical protein
MAITSNRRIINEFIGDYTLTAINAAAESTVSPGQVTDAVLTTGNNTITPPALATGATIIMPAANTILVTLKGVNGDTGIPLSRLDPTSIGLHTAAAFVLNAVSGLTVRIIWS